LLRRKSAVTTIKTKDVISLLHTMLEEIEDIEVSTGTVCTASDALVDAIDRIKALATGRSGNTDQREGPR
jgi:hypothetical protein